MMVTQVTLLGHEAAIDFLRRKGKQSSLNIPARIPTQLIFLLWDKEEYILPYPS